MTTESTPLMPAWAQVILLIIGSYWLVSRILLEYPHLLHPKHNYRKKGLGKKGLVELIAHRGSRQEGLPENTIAAFKDAVAAGAHVLEFDVWLTKDNKVVIHHDKELTRMTSSKCVAPIAELFHHELPVLEPPIGQCERTSQIPELHTHTWQNIPELKDFLEAIHPADDLFFIIEFKQNSDLLIKMVMDLLAQYPKHKANSYWFSLISAINKKLQKADPEMHNLYSVPEMLKLLALYYSGLLPFVRLDCDVLGLTIDEIPLSRVQNEAALKGLPSFVHRMLAFLFQGIPPAPMNAPGLFRHLRKRGVPVWFMNVNSESELKTAVSIGATGVLTDRINWLCNTVKKEKIAFEKISL